MRVIAGTAGSLRLTVPKGTPLRPTSDAMRETLFNILADRVGAGPFLDVYAGCGSVGIEALSRGAPACTLIERDRRCVQAIRRNLENTGLGDRAHIVRGDARRVVEAVVRERGPFNIAFLDPPYADRDGLQVAARLLTGAALEPEGMLVLQHSRRAGAPELPAPNFARRFGETEFLFFAASTREN
jgi:16S rRNA (guanine(966)-N(2))-methyltransferase RsmD